MGLEGVFAICLTETFLVDLHTRWSKLGTSWEGVFLGTLLKDVKTDASHAMAHSYGGYTTNLPSTTSGTNKHGLRSDLTAKILNPNMVARTTPCPISLLWKSAKWVRGFTLMHEDKPGFWESLGYHNYGDPWSSGKIASQPAQLKGRDGSTCCYLSNVTTP